ncbi:MAG TPA: ABC transporter permease [Thermoanaerobaculia bacterium]|nr:ABC transporter permease [Thermoanaerobaculia bacterium]
MIVAAFRSEWLKRKRSFASTLILGGSLFTPAVVAVVRLIHYRGLPHIYAADAFWKNIWRDCWESMAIFFLPLGAILATSLITQIEFRSNAWKQVHTLPVSTAVVFVSKLAVILLMMTQFLIFFTLGVYASAMIPYLLVAGVPHPKGSFWSLPLLRDCAAFFADCLPIIGAQYLIGLRAHNVLVSIGVGFLAWVGALAAVSSRFAIWWPYSYTIINYLKDKPKGAHLAAQQGLHWLAVSAFVALTATAYVLFVTKREKG